MGKNIVEKIVFVIIASVLGFLFTMAATKSTLLNKKADSDWVEKKEREIYNYVDKQDNEIKTTHSDDIKEIKEGQSKILDYILEHK